MTAKKPIKCRNNCGTTFTPQRSTAQFCSATCRVAYNRAGMSGLTADQVETIRYSVETLDEFDEFLKWARREYNAEVKKITQAARKATTPFDLEGRLEAAENRYWNKRYRFEPATLRKRAPARKR